MGRFLTGNAKTSNLPSQSLQPKNESTNEKQTGLPNKLKAGIENLSGMEMDDVKVHYNSPKPAEVQALAHTQGSNIHVGPGQEKHLPHEAWHVVQQKQGRVKRTDVLTKGTSVNHDPGLEREADEMGAKASQSGFSEHVQNNNLSPVSQTVQREVMQLKKVPDAVGATDFGQFETTKFEKLPNEKGVEIFLKFHPNEPNIDAKKIALVQSVKTTKASGDAYGIDPNTATKMVPGGKPGAGYSIDQFSDVNSPLYATDTSLGATQELKDTPASNQIGYCYKEKPADAKKKTQPATLSDKPEGGKNKGESKLFETAALAIEGTDKDKYYGSVKWGYIMEGTTAAPTVTPKDIELASKDGKPSANLIEPAKLWNVGKTRGTLQVIADPHATVRKGDASGSETLAKGTKLKQVDTAMWGTEPAIRAEVLKADGTGSGKFIYIKNVDVKDLGDGSANKKLPVPAEKEYIPGVDKG
jgi:hypothetical protein